EKPFRHLLLGWRTTIVGCRARLRRFGRLVDELEQVVERAVDLHEHLERRPLHERTSTLGIESLGEIARPSSPVFGRYPREAKLGLRAFVEDAALESRPWIAVAAVVGSVVTFVAHRGRYSLSFCSVMYHDVPDAGTP